jgi:hypothetical protein
MVKTSKEDAMTKKNRTKKAGRKYITKPTLVALVANRKGKPEVLVGARRIAAFKGEVLDKVERYWSQLKHLRIGRDKSGKLHLTTGRDAVARKLEVVS